MGARGPKPASATVIPSGATEIIQRPKSPTGLGREAAVVWNTIVSAMPADWFGPESHPLLVQYCRHTVAARKVAALIAAAEAGENLDLGDYQKLLAMQINESRIIGSLSSKMRLSQESSYDKSAKRAPLKSSTLWDG